MRLLPFAIADGARNMAADEVLVQFAAEHGVASLRLYGWAPATLSLGYFQPAADRLGHARLIQLAWVRRPSGGKALVHDHEITYALALPSSLVDGPQEWLGRVHHIMRKALESLGIRGVELVRKEQKHTLGNVLCFQQLTEGDLVLAGHKIAGSAQRKQRRCLLQHGALLMRASDHAPELPGLLELAGVELATTDVAEALVQAWQRETGWRLVDDAWTTQEVAHIEELRVGKYATDAWNHKR